MSELPNVPGKLPFSIQQYEIWANQRKAREARAERFAQHVDDIAVDDGVTFIGPKRRPRQKPAFDRMDIDTWPTDVGDTWPWNED